MAMVIGTNVSSLAAQRALGQSEKLMAEAMERLSSGKAINTGADDAAGLAKVMRMDGQVAALGQAARNITDGNAMVSAIDSSLDEVSDILVRMQTLATQSASDTTSDIDRGRIQNEYTALSASLDSIANNTRFNGTEVLNGTLTGKLLQIGAKSGETISVSQSSVKASVLGGEKFTTTAKLSRLASANNQDAANLNANGTGDKFSITVNGTSTWNGTSFFGADADETAETAAAEVNLTTGLHGVTANAKTYAFLDFGATSHTHEIEINGVTTGQVTAHATALTAMTNAINAISSQTGVVATETATDIQLYDADGGDIHFHNLTNGVVNNTNDVQIQNGTYAGARGGSSITLAIANGNDTGLVHGNIEFTGSDSFTIAEATSTALNNVTGTTGGGSSAATALSSATLDSQSNASTALGIIEGAMSKVAKMRGDLGAIINRLDHAQDSVIAEKTAVETARSAIEDADFAAESAKLAKAQVLQQVGTAMLAQANAQPQLALQLVQ